MSVLHHRSGTPRLRDGASRYPGTAPRHPGTTPRHPGTVSFGTQAPLLGTQAPLLGTETPLLGTQAPLLGTETPLLSTQTPCHHRLRRVDPVHLPVLRARRHRHGLRARASGPQAQLLGGRRARARHLRVLLLSVPRQLLRGLPARPRLQHLLQADAVPDVDPAARAGRPLLHRRRSQRLLDAPPEPHPVLLAGPPLPPLDHEHVLAVGRALHDLAADAVEPALHPVGAADLRRAPRPVHADAVPQHLHQPLDAHELPVEVELARVRPRHAALALPPPQLGGRALQRELRRRVLGVGSPVRHLGRPRQDHRARRRRRHDREPTAGGVADGRRLRHRARRASCGATCASTSRCSSRPERPVAIWIALGIAAGTSTSTR